MSQSLTIERVVAGGWGLSRSGSIVTFVRGGLPGEVVTVIPTNGIPIMNSPPFMKFTLRHRIAFKLRVPSMKIAGAVNFSMFAMRHNCSINKACWKKRFRVSAESSRQYSTIPFLRPCPMNTGEEFASGCFNITVRFTSDSYGNDRTIRSREWAACWFQSPWER